MRASRRLQVLFIALAVLGAAGAVGWGISSASGRSGAPAPMAALPRRAGANRAAPPYSVALRTVRIVEHRQMQLRDGRRVPRTVVTYVRYPTNGRRPYPLVVFGHGYDITPAPYRALLTAWARAGFIVAAPVFPLGNANAPGGPNESDIVNQPGDVSAVITRLIGLSRRSGNPFRGMVDAGRIAVAGHSDGGETALAVAYDRYYLDRRVRAAVILSGARLPIPGFSFPPGSPPLLAAQGTADPINRPTYTYRFFAAASRPKFLLRLLGASHLPPYTTEQPQLGIVERVTIDFLDRYLRGAPRALAQLRRDGTVAGLTRLTAEP